MRVELTGSCCSLPNKMMWRRLIFDRGGFDEDADPSSDTGYTHTGFVDALDRHTSLSALGLKVLSTTTSDKSSTVKMLQ
jgi:hypothetical protein